MFPKHVKLLCFLVTLPSFLGSIDTTRPHNDVNIRGNSFGLENFLFQSYEEETKPKRVRPVGNQRLTDRGHTYNLENLTAYESSKIKPFVEKTNEPIPEASKIRENVINPTTETDAVTERIRKRIMMRRRRKRPQEGSVDVTGNAIPNPVRVSISPGVSKVVVRTKQPDQEIVYRLKPLEVETTPNYPEETEKPTTTVKPSTINLKTFLKQQTETLSLSELLQTQNLSLADLIRGNKDASAILRAKQVITSTTPGVKRKYNKVESTEQTPKKLEVVEVTTARSTYRFQPKIPRIKPTEPKPTEETVEERQTKRPPFTSTGFDPQSKLNEMRLKLRNYQRKTSAQTEATTATETVTVTEAPKKRVYFKSTNNPELSVILPNKPKPEVESPKRIDRPITNRLPPVKWLGVEKPKPVEVEVEESEEEPTIPPEVRKPEPKDELFELLKSGQNADRLQKILSARNMTLQELLDNREKPPQMNITELFSSQERTTQQTFFDNPSDFEGEGEYDEPEMEESAPSIARIRPIPQREAKQIPVVVSYQPDDVISEKPHSDISSLWKLSDNGMFYGSSYGYGFVPQTEKPKTTQQTESDVVLLETIQTEQENRKFKLDFNEFIRQVDEPQTEDIEKSYIPPAVKSAIIASGVVMGIALFVFIAIFAACGWKQRQIRLKGGDLKKNKGTLSPVSFRDTSYKKSLDFDETSESGTSNTSSYLWSTLKNTFTSRTSTLKSRLEKEEKMREDKVTLRRNESRRKESRSDERQITEERFLPKKIDRDRNIINTSFNFKRSTSGNHFNECIHGY